MKMKTNQLEAIKKYMEGKEKCHISEISQNTGILKNSVMGCLNKYVILGKHFTRLGKGDYSLLEEKIETPDTKK